MPKPKKIKVVKAWIIEDGNWATNQMIAYQTRKAAEKWGIEIGVILKNPKENKGRKLGNGYSPTGIAKDLFGAQKTINKIEKYSKEKFREMTDKEIKLANKKPFIKIY